MSQKFFLADPDSLFFYRPDDGDFTESRGSIAYQRSVSGVLTSVSSGVLRNEHYLVDPATGSPVRTTLVEGQRTNMLTYSSDFSNAVWDKFSCTLGDSIEGPDGVAGSATKVAEDAAISRHGVGRAVSLAISTVQATSVVAAPGGRTWMRIFTQGKDSVRESFVNLGTGQVGTVAEGHTVSVIPLANGFYQISVCWNTGSGTGSPSVYFGPAMGDGVPIYAGTAGLGIYLWNAQHESGVYYASSPIRTTSSAVIRSADALRLPLTHVEPVTCTLFFDFIEQGMIASKTNEVIAAIRGPSPSAQYVQVWVPNSANLNYSFIYSPAQNPRSSGGGGTIARVGERVRLRAVIYEDGSVQLFRKVGSAAEEENSLAGSATAFPDLWSTSVVNVGFGNGAAGSVALISAMGRPGVVTMDDCIERTM